MKIAISATGPDLEAQVDPRFGRCRYFIIADPETMEFEAVDNSSAMAAGGAGISAAQAIADMGVKAVMTGNCGPNAYQVLSPAGTRVITSVSGKIRDAIEGYQSGKFQTTAQQANVPDHFGMGAQSMGSGSGIGGGRGMGGGMGRGMDRGKGFGMSSPESPEPQLKNPEQELELLKAQSQTMAQQLNDIQRQIDELEKKRK
jgi:predicted Fe-Mo cluster-binding NifX family protein